MGLRHAAVVLKLHVDGSCAGVTASSPSFVVVEKSVADLSRKKLVIGLVLAVILAAAIFIEGERETPNFYAQQAPDTAASGQVQDATHAGTYK